MLVVKNIYEYRKIYHTMLQNSINCSANRVLRIMKANNICSKVKKKFKATTNSKHNLPITNNILDREFVVHFPNTHWVGDISYISTKEGWLYLATVIDLYSRAVVGWALRDRMTSKLVEDALLMAIWRRKPKHGLIFHSDRGSQYASGTFQKLLNIYFIISSMSRKGNCWDNAVAESFFKTIKTELTYHFNYETKEEAKQSIFEYIEVFYNRKRLHSSIGYMAPMQFEMAA
jgi:transposase InsO family protein